MKFNQAIKLLGLKDFKISINNKYLKYLKKLIIKKDQKS
jgi:hypothetical protein